MNVDRPRNDRVLYLGFNGDSADAEANALRTRGASVKQLRAHEGSEIVMDGLGYDLASEDGIHAFCKDLCSKHGMGPEHEDALAAAFRACIPSGRDELAQVAMEWAPAEEGHAIPSRLVVSGHHGGAFFNGGSDLHDESLRALAAALPNAARQVEDIHFSGCNTAGPVRDFESWHGTFPNLKTLWGYANSAPLVPAGHLVEWELATRGRGDFFSKSGMQNHHNAIAWSSRGGLAGANTSLPAMREARDDADTRYDGWVAGRSYGDEYGRDDNAAYRDIARATGASPAERAEAQTRADVLLRARFYESHVRVRFARENGATIARAYAEVGMSAPDFSKLTRSQALSEIHSFFERVAEKHPRRDADMNSALESLHALATLDPSFIPESWCH